METKKLIGYGSIVLAGIGVIALCIGINSARKAKKAIKNIDITISKLADMTPVEVSDMVVDKATEKAVDAAVDKAATEAVEKVRKDINLRVSNAVTLAYDSVEEKVVDKLNNAIDKEIDMDDFKKKVENKASSELASKFIANLSDYAGPIVSGIMSAVKEKEN